MIKPQYATVFSLLFLLLSIFLRIQLPFLNFCTSPHQDLTLPEVETNATAGSKSESPKKNFIVRFIVYKDAKDHRDYLYRSVKLAGWDWIERRNAASKYPTDFGVISIKSPVAGVLVKEIERLSLVKDVSADHSYTRSLFMKDESEQFRSVGTFCDGRKRPGKIFTKISFNEEGESEMENRPITNETISWGRHLMMQRSQVTSLFGADVLWAKGYTGAKVKMAIFDTGIRSDHPHFRNIKERTNWTNEDTLNDNLGHGTFVAGVIAGQDPECRGFAPDTEIYAFRVFTDAQVSYTSWFLDAFNYAIATNMDVLNLSIGGPDHMDLPFVEKVWELTANNIIMVSAIGNDGPLYGTLNNPADQSDVIGVGGIDYSDSIASFSSRGMSTWEIPHGYGRVKPDIVAYGRDIMGSKISTGCKSLSGTSVASPVVAGVVCLLVSIIPENRRKHILNPASMKQALVEGAAKLSGPNMYEQGAGRVDLLESYEILQKYQPRATIFPGVLDYTDCPYAWPFCQQPMYAGAMPVIFNATILNGMGVVGYVNGSPTWHPLNEEDNLLHVQFMYSDVIWPWTGYLALHMQIKEEGADFNGLIEGQISIKVSSPPGVGEKAMRTSTCVLQLRIKVVPTPPRSKRILWDQFHNIKYPPGYVPRDSLDVRNDILDWHGDHLHTNFHTMFNMLRDAGYYVETLGSPLTCFDARQYGTLLLVDLEEEFFEEEIKKLKEDVINTGLGLVVFAEWYNVDTMVKMRFFDDNTRSWWTPVTGGANIPALNDLLASFGIAFGDRVLNGDFTFDGEQTRYATGTNILKFPAGGYVHSFPFLDTSEGVLSQNMLSSSVNKVDHPILGFLELGKGQIAVYGDSNCLDSSHMVTNCFQLLRKMLSFTMMNIKDPVLFSDSVRLKTPLYVDEKQLPARRLDVNFSVYSAVLGKELICASDSRFEVHGTKGYNVQIRGRNKKLSGNPVIDLGRGLNATADVLSVVNATLKHKGDSMRNKYLSFLYREELDMPVLAASYWLVPAVFAACGLLFLSFWRIRQRRRRRRKGSGSGRFPI